MDISKLKPGDHHYMAYVGPPARYDFMGATQFRLLCTLGLRAKHYLLDVGCGSLRAGRLFITYLDKGRYFGIEPNEWLVDDAIENQVGRDLIRIKRPRFDHNSDFATGVFGEQFDFIIAQSVFSHSGRDLISIALSNCRESLKETGLMAATFVEGIVDFAGDGWVYPGCVHYRPSTIRGLAANAGLLVTRSLVPPWADVVPPFSREKSRLPDDSMLRYLSGVILFDPDLADSWQTGLRRIRIIKRYARQILPKPIKDAIRKLMRDRADGQ